MVRFVLHHESTLIQPVYFKIEVSILQYIIDLLKDWVYSQNYLTQAMFNRGDPGVNDFAVGDFAKDNAWHALDLSAIVPAGAIGVALTLRIRSIVINQQFRVRRHGNVNEAVRSMASTQVANNHNFSDLVTACDSDRVIDYRVSLAPWTNIDLTVKSWWF